MDGDMNGRPRRPRRVFRRSDAVDRQLYHTGNGESEGSVVPTAPLAASASHPQGAALLERAPAPRLVGPSAIPGAPPRAGSPAATALTTSGESGPRSQITEVTPRGGSGGGAAASVVNGDGVRSAAAEASPLDATPVPAHTALDAETAMESAMLSRQVIVDRSLFTTIAFSPSIFVNNIAQRLLYPVLQKHRTKQKRHLATGGTGGANDSGSGTGVALGSGNGTADGRADNEAARLLNSEGTSLFGNSRMPMSVRARVGAVPERLGGTGADGRPDGIGATNTDFASLAGQLTSTLEEASEEVRRLLEEEEAFLHREEVKCKRIEKQEKRRLAAVRLGLEGTSARLQMYENRVSNAQAATAGIEQHLAQSNARVQRGKSVSQLLRYLKMMTAISRSDLRGLLTAISAARKMQRAAVTARWAAGRVSVFRPRFYTTVVNTAAPSSKSNASKHGSPTVTRAVSTSSHWAGSDANTETGAHEDVLKRSASATALSPRTDAQPTDNTRRPRVFRSGGRRQGGAASNRVSPRRQARSLSPARSAKSVSGEGEVGDNPDDAVNARGGVGGNTMYEDSEVEPEDLGDDDEAAAAMEDGGGGADGEAIVDLKQVRMQRAESAAVAAGLDRLFALRFCTEAQVEWCQRLVMLSNELGNLVTNIENIQIYVDWLRNELVSDLFHVVTCFNDFYNENPQTAMHQAYGRALLKTLGRISSLYNTLTPSNDALLSLFFSRSINDLGLVLHSEWSPKPLPGLPPLPQTSELRAMDHYRQHYDKALQTAFRFLLDRIRRNVVVVETIFGTTSTARQQLLSRVTDGVVKPFLSQQIKLAETQATSIIQSEGGLSPRTKRRCGARVADIVAYYHTIEARLYTFYQEYVKELKNVFSANEVEFLSRFVDVIFGDRGAYSRERTELDLLNRYFTLIEEKYTRSLHAIPDDFFDLREAHMAKMKEVVTCLTEVTGRVKTYAIPREVGPYVYDLIKATLVYVGNYLDTELRKVLDSLRSDRDNWRVKPKSEEELLKPPKTESQRCAIRMLLFAQSSLMSLSDTIDVICAPLLEQFPRLLQDLEEARNSALEALDERSERVLNTCVQAILLRSLSILQHYQLKSDYLPKADSKRDDVDTVAPPCTRACTLFCYYITRQFDMASEFIRLSNGQAPQRPTSTQKASSSAIGAAVQQQQQEFLWQVARGAAAEAANGGDGNIPGSVLLPTTDGALPAPFVLGANAARGRAHTMNLHQLVYGDGGPSSFVRTLGVCLYRGISTHLKSFVANDRGALVYKQDVTAYKVAMTPLTSTPGLGGAVVEVLFQMLKETSSLLIMPLDHIREVKDSGYLKLMSAEEKLRYLSIRQDVRSAMKIISH
ncbi:hypothetical protein JKF63_04838 [Porcisia hertigi]|uniref:Exocyst complex component Sec10-like alpha-helical bundle domain-containing protein n=1 Tax=Porcisia hertigi TaxID=2761500 RepID=A0A836HR79_9TRYP|nr:hypothetical protein JKF63_04838 [Porcisia hertigi]